MCHAGTLAQMIRRLLSLVSVVILAVACSADGTPPTVTGPSATVESSPGESEAPAPPEATTTRPDGSATTAEPDEDEPLADAAPDFSLQLGDGGTFVLSQETKPIFMVFWAEW
ncbi:hypothetical protein BH23ACT5_BH23ACT5_15840 [soil metagenome]